MQRSSQSIASLAAALAKAQIELANPEKSLLGTIKSGPGRDGPERVFRYAPLSSGLEIVRKTLGQHEIATVQTTAIDQAAGIVNLTTVLAHASGEWIASDWPVCPISDTATPHRMGAALTYARRYALFTLVGIAGEDDLDAPDLVAPTTPSSGLEQIGGAGVRFNGGAKPHSVYRPPVRRHSRAFPNLPTPNLAPEASAQLRDQLLSQLDAIADGDKAALWAKRSLPDKNKLVVADAQRVEEAFQVRLAGIAPVPGQTEQRPQSRSANPKAPRKQRASKTIDKSVLALPEPRRIRDRDHVRFVAKQPCLICGRRPADAHHLRFTQSRALGRKVSDEFTVPLCRGHHREVHCCGDEAAWWQAAGVDPNLAAGALWRETHPLAMGRGDMGVDGPTSVAVRNTSRGGAKHNGPVDKASSDYKTKPNIGAIHE